MTGGASYLFAPASMLLRTSERAMNVMNPNACVLKMENWNAVGQATGQQDK